VETASIPAESARGETSDSDFAGCGFSVTFSTNGVNATVTGLGVEAASNPGERITVPVLPFVGVIRLPPPCSLPALTSFEEGEKFD